MKTKHVIDIPPSARGWSLDQSPLTARLRNALRKRGHGKVGKIHGKTFAQILKIRGCGVGSLADLKHFLRRLHAGEFERLAAGSAAEAPCQAVRMVDDFCAGLKERERDMVLTRLGAQQEPLTLAEIGHKYGLTRERVRQIVAVHMEKLSRHGGPPFMQLLCRIVDTCSTTVCPLTPELLIKWLEPKQVSRLYSPGFYVRVFGELIPECPTWPKGRGAGQPDERQTEITAAVKLLLQDRTKAVPAKEVLLLLKAQRRFAGVTPLELLEALRQDISLGLTFARPDHLLLQPPAPELVKCVKQVLADSARALSARKIIERARAIWGERALLMPAYRLGCMLRPEDGIYLLDTETYGLLKHVRCPRSLWSRIADEVVELLQRDGWQISISEIINQSRFDWTRSINPNELAVLLLQDPRLTDLGRGFFALSVPDRPTGMLITQQLQA